MDDKTQIIAALKKSGFPLQTRVEHEIQARRATGWKLEASEYPWMDVDGRDQFIDLIACCKSELLERVVVLVIECKKAQERSLLFLCPFGSERTGPVTTVRTWSFVRAADAYWAVRDDIAVEPASYRAAFCVTTDKDKAGQRLLEPDARLVMFAADEAVSDSRLSRLPVGSLFLPIIVTSARLYTLHFQPTEIDLDTGDFGKLDPARLESIQWVRFHKTFTARGDGTPRTIFVVSSGALPSFLDEISRWQGIGAPK